MIHATLALLIRWKTPSKCLNTLWNSTTRVKYDIISSGNGAWQNYKLTIIRLEKTSTDIPNPMEQRKSGLPMAEEKPCLSFGVIADIQYADAEDGYNFSKTSRRYYRTALSMLDKAIKMWNNDTLQQPQFILQLGDIIDGCNKRLGISESSLQAVLRSFSNFPNSVYHIWGNHEFYNFSQEFLLKSKLYSGNDSSCLPVSDKAYYACLPHPKLRILALDTYEISLLASLENTSEFQLAQEYMANNQNTDKNSGEGLTGVMKRFVKFNGAVSDQQLDWIQHNLEEARSSRQNVIMMGHCGIFEDATAMECLCWNAPTILKLTDEYSDCTLCYFSGHDHGGGLAFDGKGMLHMAFPGVLENNSDSDFGTVYMYADKLCLQGNGRVPSLTLPLKFRLDEEIS